MGKKVSLLYKKIRVRKAERKASIRDSSYLDAYKQDFFQVFKEEFGRLPELNRENDKRFFMAYARHRMFREKGKYYDHNKLHLKGAAETRLHSLLERSKKRGEK